VCRQSWVSLYSSRSRIQNASAVEIDAIGLQSVKAHSLQNSAIKLAGQVPFGLITRPVVNRSDLKDPYLAGIDVYFDLSRLRPSW